VSDRPLSGAQGRAVHLLLGKSVLGERGADPSDESPWRKTQKP